VADQQQFREFVLARSAALSRTAYLLTGDVHRAEDLLQTSLARAAAAWHRIEGDPEPYVRRILHHQSISWWRRRRVRETPWPEGYDAPAGGSTDPDLRLSLDRALGLLTPKQRSVLVLRFYDDLTEVEAARVLGIAPGTVKSTTRQALARLRATSPHLAELTGATP